MSEVIDLTADRSEPLLADTLRVVLDRRDSIVTQLRSTETPFDVSEVWVDFANVDTVNSAELSAVIQFTLRMRQCDKSVRVCNVGPLVEEIFQITRFSSPYQVR